MDLGDLAPAALPDSGLQSLAFDHLALISMNHSAREPIDCRVTVTNGELVVRRRGSGILLSVRLARVTAVDAKLAAVELLVDGTPVWIDFRARTGRAASSKVSPVRALRCIRGWIAREQFRRAVRGPSAPAQWERRASDRLGNDEFNLADHEAGADRGFD